jgi:phage shock protein PspC (stress-responsive transcriptional regulator)
MSSPYLPQPPKRLERSKSNRIVGGVCAGVANYLNMDPTLVRVLTVVISLFTGVPVILYIVALFRDARGGVAAEPAELSTSWGSASPSGGGYSPTPQQTAPPAYAPTLRRQVPRLRSLSRQQPARFQPMTPSGAAKARPGSNASLRWSRLLRAGVCCVGATAGWSIRAGGAGRTTRPRGRRPNRHLSLSGPRSVPPTPRAPLPRAHPSPNPPSRLRAVSKPIAPESPLSKENSELASSALVRSRRRFIYRLCPAD